jgi:hypothetical protein
VAGAAAVAVAGVADAGIDFQSRHRFGRSLAALRRCDQELVSPAVAGETRFFSDKAHRGLWKLVSLRDRPAFISGSDPVHS